MNTRVYRRVLRRETHRARSVVAVIAAAALAALALAVAWLAIDGSTRHAAVSSLDLLAQPVTAATVATLAGILAAALILCAILPGRIRRRGLTRDRIAVLIDDRVIANAVVDAIARGYNIPASRIEALVERRRVVVRLTPTSGVAMDDEAVRNIAALALADAGVPLSVDVSIAAKGAIA